MAILRSLACVLFSSLALLHAHPTKPKFESNSFHFWPDLPSSRQEHAVAFTNGNLYVAGGISSSYSYTPDTLDVPLVPSLVDLVQRYDSRTRTWSDVAPLPVSINHGNMASVGGKIYLLGGLLGLNFSLWDGTPNAYVYDPESNIWSGLTPAPEETARGASAVGVRGSEIYLAGGMGLLEVSVGGLQDSVAIVTSYNTETDTWTTDYPPLPAARDHIGGAVIGNKFYVTGGRNHGQLNVGANTWALDLDNPSAGWENLAPLPTPRGGLAAAAVGHCLYTFGGEGNPNSPHGVFDNIEVYDTRTGVWTQLPPLWAGFHGTQAVTGDRGIIHIPGGGYQISASPSNFSAAYVPDWSCFGGK